MAPAKETGRTRSDVVSDVAPLDDATTQVAFGPTAVMIARAESGGCGLYPGSTATVTDGSHAVNVIACCNGVLRMSRTWATIVSAWPTSIVKLLKFTSTRLGVPAPSAVGSLLQLNAAPATSAAIPNIPTIRAFMRSSRVGLDVAPRPSVVLLQIL